nr:MAG TPA: hypothetical protein [Caudoviricetes sp.]
MAWFPPLNFAVADFLVATLVFLVNSFIVVRGRIRL